jgi:hypothetical protein
MCLPDIQGVIYRRGLTVALVVSTPALLPEKEPRRGRISTPTLAFARSLITFTLGVLLVEQLSFSSLLEFSLNHRYPKSILILLTFEDKLIRLIHI